MEDLIYENIFTQLKIYYAKVSSRSRHLQVGEH